MAITAIHPYLHFDGQCEEAFRHYEKALGARCTGIHRYRDMPADAAGESNPDCPPPSAESLDRVMNVELRVGALVLMALLNLMTLLGIGVFYQPIVTGLVVIIFAIAYRFQK